MRALESTFWKTTSLAHTNKTLTAKSNPQNGSKRGSGLKSRQNCPIDQANTIKDILASNHMLLQPLSAFMGKVFQVKITLAPHPSKYRNQKGRGQDLPTTYFLHSYLNDCQLGIKFKSQLYSDAIIRDLAALDRGALIFDPNGFNFLDTF